MDSSVVRTLGLILSLLSGLISLVVGIGLMFTADGTFTTQFGVGLLLVFVAPQWLKD